MDIFPKYVSGFLFILLRAGIVISLLPFFGSRTFPAQFKIGFAVAVALVLTPVVEFRVENTAIPILIMREIIFGVALGLAARFIFFAVDIASRIISNAIGMAMATAFDPELGHQSPELGQLYGLVAMLIFLSMDAHHDLLYIFVRSYEWLPAGSIETKNLVFEVVDVTARMFVIALKISAPVVVTMLITHLLLGFVYKAAPQMNIFFVAYPVYILVGFIVLIVSLPVFVPVLSGYINMIKDEMTKVIALSRS